MDVTTILSLIQFAIQEEPKVAASLHNIFSKGPEPTPADWQAERDAVAKLKYEDLVPDTKLPPDGSTPPPAPPAA